MFVLAEKIKQKTKRTYNTHNFHFLAAMGRSFLGGKEVWVGKTGLAYAKTPVVVVERSMSIVIKR